MLIPTKHFEGWPEILTIFIVSLSMLNYGLLYGWPSSAIVTLTSGNYPIHLTSDEASYLTTLNPIAAIISSLPVAYIHNRVGRKKTLLFGLVPYFISWILLGIGESKWIIYASRFVTGIGDTCAVCVSTLYVCEIATPKVRGTWGNFLVLNLFIGLLLSYILGGYLDMLTTVYACVGLPVIQFVLMLSIPESPYFLLMTQRYKEAKTSLQWLRQREDVDAEFVTMTEAVERQMLEPGSFKDIFCIKSNRRAMIAVVMLRLAQQLSGMSAFVVYAQSIFEQAGGDLSSSTCAVIYGSTQLVFSVVGCIIVGKFGRRKALFSSGVSSVIMLILMTIYFYLDTNTDIDVSGFRWFPLVGMIIFLMVFSTGLALLPSLMSGELFSSSVKAKSMSINNILFAGMIAASTKLFQVISEFGLYASFAFCAIACAISLLGCYFVVPETKGKTLDEIQQLFQDKEVDA